MNRIGPQVSTRSGNLQGREEEMGGQVRSVEGERHFVGRVEMYSDWAGAETRDKKYISKQKPQEELKTLILWFMLTAGPFLQPCFSPWHRVSVTRQSREREMEMFSKNLKTSVRQMLRFHQELPQQPDKSKC